MLLGSFLDFYEAYCDYWTNNEVYANSSRESRNEYALAAASVTDFLASLRPRWGKGGRPQRRLPLVGTRAPPLFHQPAFAALPTARSILRLVELQLLRMWHRRKFRFAKIADQHSRPTSSTSFFDSLQNCLLIKEKTINAINTTDARRIFI